MAMESGAWRARENPALGELLPRSGSPFPLPSERLQIGLEPRSRLALAVLLPGGVAGLGRRGKWQPGPGGASSAGE